MASSGVEHAKYVNIPPPEDRAPEVVPSTAPIVQPRQDEGLEVHTVWPKTEGQYWNGSQEWNDPKSALLEPSQHKWKPARWKWWVWLAIASTVCAVIAIAVGLAVHFTTAKSPSSSFDYGSNKDSISQPTNTSTTSLLSSSSSSSSSRTSSTTSTPTTRSTTKTSTTTSSSFSAAATAGTTGIASFTCNSTVSTDHYTTPSNPTTFTEECFVDYPAGSLSKDGAHNVTDYRSSTVYSFQECMQECARYNAEEGGTPCRAVTYRANLTATVANFGGNCWLKNARGVGRGGYEDARLMGSAYIDGAGE